MADKSKIEWTDATWNPVTGCDKVGPGCDHCYAEIFAERWRGTPGHAYEQGFDLKLWPERLSLPLSWKRPRRIFVNSMSDLFHKDIPDEYIRQVFDVMVSADWHIFQVLTKRSSRMTSLGQSLPWPAHIWAGVTIELDRMADRADHLRRTPAEVRFISAEPLLGPLPNLDLADIDQLIVGGESGPGARPMHPDWPRQIRDACQEAGVAYFFKQWGSYLPLSQLPANAENFNRGPIIDAHGERFIACGKKASGRLLDGRTWDEFPKATHA